MISNKNYFLKGNTSAKIVLISDIHYYNKKELPILNKVLNEIKKINPDYICIPGDITDESKVIYEQPLIDWISKLSSISKVIISLGNHEFYIDKSNNVFGLNHKLIDKIKNIKNVYLLDNESIVLNNINFIGVTLPISYYIDEENGLDITPYIYNFKTNKNNYNVLLCHTPMNIYKEDIIKKLGVDLILCGHMHGGITPNILRPILKNTGLASPKRKPFPKNCYGHLKKLDTDIIITSGIVKLSHENEYRLFNRFFSSEIVTITIKDK